MIYFVNQLYGISPSEYISHSATPNDQLQNGTKFFQLESAKKNHEKTQTHHSSQCTHNVGAIQ